MKAYWITRCHVHNAPEYNEYIKLAGPAISKHGGKFLVRGEQMKKAADRVVKVSIAKALKDVINP